MRIPRIYTAQTLDAEADFQLEAGPAAHVARVLRMATGDALLLFDGRGGVLFSDRHAADGIAMFRRCHWLMDISDRGWRKDHRSHDRGSDAVADGSSSSRDSCMAGHWFSDAATDPRRSTALAICGRGAEG